MKTKHLLMTLLLALLVPWAAQAQLTMTVCEGEVTNLAIPLNGYSTDTQGSCGEFIIPASQLSGMIGSEISQISFYPQAGYSWSATFQVYVKEVTETSLNSTLGPNACTVVYTGSLDASGTTMDIPFDNNYSYSGGNLLIGTYISVAGNYFDHAYFYGIEAEGAAYASGTYSGSYNGSYNFIPKTTFTYFPADFCYEPANVHIVENTLGPREVAIEWDAESGELFEESMQATSSFDPNNIHWSGASTSHFEEWDRLTPDTDYTFCVRKKCGTDSYSQPVFLEFRTTVACPAPTLALVANSETARGATLSWTGFSDSYTLQYIDPATATITGYEVKTEEVLSEGFEGGSMPTGWIADSYWNVGSGTGHSSGSTSAGTGNYNAYCYRGSYDGEYYLITPKMDLSTATSATLTFQLNNTSWGGDINELHVLYRVNEGSWNTLSNASWTTSTSGWETKTVTLAGFADNYQIAFYCVNNYSYGTGIDEIQINAVMSVPVYEWNEIENATSPYTFTTLDPEITYWARVIGNCGSDGLSQPSNVVSFTTALACTKPTNVAAELQAYNAYNITWEGESDTYTLRYRTAEVTEGGFSDDFENGLFKWNVIDADGDGYGWVLASESPGIYHNQNANLTGSGHNGSNDMLLSASYSNITGVLTPDNYLVTPKVELGETFSFWAQAQDASYPAEHFGVAVSTASNNDPDDFTTIQEWTLTAKGTGAKANPGTTRSGNRAQGTWYQFSVDLSDYAGQEGYIAIRHFGCTDMFILNVDDVVYGESTVVAPAGEWVVVENIANTQYLLEGLEEETAYEFQLQGICEGYPSAWTAAAFFTTFADEPIGVLDGGYWEDPNTWLEGQTPEVNDPVAIIGDVIIGGDLTANGEITIAEGASLTVEPGVVVNAGDITLAEGASMTIQEGAVFNANEITVTTPDQLIIEPNVEFTHNTEVPATLTFGYTASNAKDGEYGLYRLIASPITPYVTVNSTGLVPESSDANYQYVDLYYFDQSRSATDENGTNGAWINYKQVDNMFVSLDLKKGYLYANGQNALGLFAGQTLPTSGIEVYVDLDYTAGNNLAGWNLVGNPFTCTTYITDGTTAVPYYALNATGTDLEAKEAGTALAPMRGAFVQATATGQRAYFITTQPSRGASLGITLNQGRGMIDNAYINFGGGNTLEKFQLNPNHTKIYMPIEGKDYAVTNAESMGEMPVSFKAEKNGTYTLGFNTENVEFSYLHLIDNLTGNDVNLLETPSYSFEAKTTDYASRFRLVFSTGSNDDNFAFFNNGNIIVNNEGEATLQVMDVNGRIIRSESINGTASIKMNASAGVYMLRLINGNDVKVQKMIVK